VLLYVIRRLAWLVVSLVAVSLITFVVFYTLPSSDPARLRAGKAASTKTIERIRHDLGLDRSAPVQYWRYTKRLVLHGDLGYSYVNNASVRSELADRLPATLSLTGGAVVIWLALGVPAGIAAALRPRGLFDRASMAVALLAISAPVFWVGLVSLYLLSNDIGVFKLFDGAGTYRPLSDSPSAWFGSLVLPWMVLAASFAGFYARLLRGNLLEAMSEDHVRAARAKGISEGRVVTRHAMRVAVTPVVTVLGLDIGVLLGGAILTESVFNIPGIGGLAFDGIRHADLPVIQGTVLVGALFVVLANLVVDLVHGALDPRVRAR
jgi:peptide/nickel transport system permease protein